MAELKFWLCYCRITAENMVEKRTKCWPPAFFPFPQCLHENSGLYVKLLRKKKQDMFVKC